MERSARASLTTVALFFLFGYAGAFAVTLTGYRLTTVQCAWVALAVAAVASGMAWSWPRLRELSAYHRTPLLLVVLTLPTFSMVVLFWLSVIGVLPAMNRTTAFLFFLWMGLGAGASVSTWLVPRVLVPSRVRRLVRWVACGGVLIFIAGVVWTLTLEHGHRTSLFDGLVEFLRRRLG